MPAPEHNQNATKPAGQVADSFLHVRVKRSDKARWVRAANARARQDRQTDDRGNLAGWVIDTLNKATPKPDEPQAPKP